ncbi:RHS repeat protein, partial [bacterium]|nr:RHS repeat protein [bacterium]
NYNLANVTNPRAATRTYTYDAADRLTHIEDATGHLTDLTYDAAGNLKATEYATGARVLRDYLAGGLLSTLSLPAEETTWTFTYTSTNRLATVTDQGSRGYTFDCNPIGWLTRATDTFDTSVAGGFATTYAHDEAGRVTGIRAASDESTRTYSYDLRGALEELALPSDSGSVHTTYDYEASGLVTALSLPDGSTTAYGYDDAGRLASLTTTTGAADVLAFAYTRDENGNVRSVGETRYVYDEVNRLASWYDPSSDATTTYMYDANYNLKSVSVDGSLTTSFTFNAADRISNSGFAYDDAGNMTSDGDLDYVYDSANRLVAVRDASTEATLATYAYDHMNRRVSSMEGSATTFYHYDGATPNVIAETDGNGATIASYTYDSSGRL